MTEIDEKVKKLGTMMSFYADLKEEFRKELTKSDYPFRTISSFAVKYGLRTTTVKRWAKELELAVKPLEPIEKLPNLVPCPNCKREISQKLLSDCPGCEVDKQDALLIATNKDKIQIPIETPKKEEFL